MQIKTKADAKYSHSNPPQSQVFIVASFVPEGCLLLCKHQFPHASYS